MKKLLALILTMMVGLSLAGCGGGSDAEKADWEYIEAKGEMIIGITYYAPMNYLDADGNLIGFETEFAEAVCEKLGVTPKFQEIDWNSKETELASKTIDVIWNGMTVTPDRAQNMDLSVSYLNNRPVMIVRNDKLELLKTAADLAGKIIVAETGSAADGIVQEDEFFAQGTYTAVDTQVKTFMELASGTADVAVGDYVMAIGSLGAGTDFENLVISPYWNGENEEYAAAFRKGSPETVQKMNDAIAALKADGTLAQIAEKYKLSELLIQ